MRGSVLAHFEKCIDDEHILVHWWCHKLRVVLHSLGDACLPSNS